MRIRYAILAILVALAAVTAGAQASSSSDETTGAGGVRLYEGPSRPHTSSGKISLNLRGSGSSLTRATFGNDDFTMAPLVSNFDTPGPCRFPSECSADDDNSGASLQTGEPNTCTGPSGSITFDNTVWLVVRPSHTGIMDVRIDNASPAGFRPVFVIAPYDPSTGTPDFPNGTCDIANDLNHVYSDSFTITSPGYIAMAVARTTTGGATSAGTFTWNLSWDPDTDEDGLLDSQDRCDTQRGPASLRGCPDSDGDHIANIDDRCPTQGGPASLRGCPDSDGDGIPNIDDSCDTLRGPRSLGGCPDSDGDGLINPRDACPTESSAGKTDQNHNGCPDYKALPDLKAQIAGVIKGNKVVGVKFTSLRFRSKAPKGTKVSIKCKPRKNCKLRKRGSLRKRLRFVSFRRKVTKITIKATKKGYVGKVFSLKVTYKTVRGGGRNVILKGPKKRCIPVGQRSSRKCTGSLLLR